MPKTCGYIRVSTLDQDLTVQLEALIGAGVKPDLIIKEKASGTKRDGRDKLDLLLKLADKGDTIVITRVDRLAHSMHDLQNIVHELKSKGVALKVTEQPINTSTAAGKAFFDMLGVFTEFETNLRRERQAEDIAKAKREGVYTGGKRRIDREEVAALLGRGLNSTEVSCQLGVSRPEAYRIRDELLEKTGC